jgi:hypothetical protein
MKMREQHPGAERDRNHHQAGGQDEPSRPARYPTRALYHYPALAMFWVLRKYIERLPGCITGGGVHYQLAGVASFIHQKYRIHSVVYNLKFLGAAMHYWSELSAC